jgi:CheY-like chemotaxis protein
MASPKPATILCVDDEDVPLFLRKRVLEKSGYDVITANSARQALTLLESHQVDIVLSDQLMPEMTGTQLAKILKESRASLPFILISGVNEMPSDIGYADVFISKLEGPAALCQKIAEVIATACNDAPNASAADPCK